jgi:hypothetical protein
LFEPCGYFDPTEAYEFETEINDTYLIVRLKDSSGDVLRYQVISAAIIDGHTTLEIEQEIKNIRMDLLKRYAVDGPTQPLLDAFAKKNSTPISDIERSEIRRLFRHQRQNQILQK